MLFRIYMFLLYFLLLFNMISKPSSNIYIHAPNVQFWARGGVLKSLTSYERWLDNVFISGDNSHLISWFRGVVLDSTTIFKITSF